MHGSHNRSLLLAAGRRSTALWLFAGRLSDLSLKAHTYAAYTRLAPRRRGPVSESFTPSSRSAFSQPPPCIPR
jgi:hypothetical protein